MRVIDWFKNYVFWHFQTLKKSLTLNFEIVWRHCIDYCIRKWSQRNWNVIEITKYIDVRAKKNVCLIFTNHKKTYFVNFADLWKGWRSALIVSSENECKEMVEIMLKILNIDVTEKDNLLWTFDIYKSKQQIKFAYVNVSIILE
jgi:hypothetical protein